MCSSTKSYYCYIHTIYKYIYYIMYRFSVIDTTPKAPPPLLFSRYNVGTQLTRSIGVCIYVLYTCIVSV